MLIVPHNALGGSELLGGKGKSLAALSSAGLPVPNWFGISSSAFEEFIRPSLERIILADEQIRTAERDDLAGISKEIIERLSALDINQELLSCLQSALGRTAKRFSVRSSANEEDSSTCSFAGIFETYLNVPAERVGEHIKYCWLSAFSPAALHYCKQTLVRPSSIRMSVVIQDMIFSHKSGVLFQVDPSGRLDEQVIVAGYGLGEGVVDGLVGTDTIYISKTSGDRRVIKGTKSERLECIAGVEGGVRSVSIPNSMREGAVLDGNEVQQLLELSEKVKTLYTEFQDIEWAIDQAGDVWVLQSRPITTIPKGEMELYDNTNIVESYPGVSSPLTTSFVKLVYEKMFYHAFHKCGYSYRVLNANIEPFSRLVESIQGRIYYNLSSWYKMMSLTPLSSSLAIPALEDAIGASRENKTYKQPLSIRFYKNVVLGIFVSRYFFYDAIFNRYSNRFSVLQRNAKKEYEEARSNVELLRVLTEFLRCIFPVEQFGRVSDAYLMVALFLTKLFAKSRGLDEEKAQELINGLLVGEQDLESVKPVRSVRRMAALVASNEGLKAALMQRRSWSDLVHTLRKVDPKFLECLECHLEMYGDRSVGELKLETRTFRENPGGLIDIVLTQARSPSVHLDTRERESLLRRESEQRFLSLCGAISRPIAKYLIRQLRKFVRAREFTRLNRARYYGTVRAIYMRIGKNWVKDGVLDQVDDIFYLEATEVEEAINRREVRHLKETVLRRKREWADWERRKPANRMWLKGEVKENVVPQHEQIAPSLGAERQKEMRGIGCCPGVVEAKAIVLNAPTASIDSDGKIIVAESTDPGWVFLIMSAAGLVMEKGSLLSHTAIIGRELGIPTIVGVENATLRIEPDSLIEIDGAAGTIQQRDGELVPRHFAGNVVSG